MGKIKTPRFLYILGASFSAKKEYNFAVPLKSRCLKVGNFTVWAKIKFTIFIRAIIVAYQIKPLDVIFPMIAAFFSKSINITRYQALNVCKELLILRKMLI